MLIWHGRGGHATPNVTAEITYDLAAGRADYYLWDKEEPPGKNAYMWYKCDYANVQQTCTTSGSTSIVQIYLTEQRSGMRWPVKLKGYEYVTTTPNGTQCDGYYRQRPLNDSDGRTCFNDNGSARDADRKLLPL